MSEPVLPTDVDSLRAKSLFIDLQQRLASQSLKLIGSKDQHVLKREEQKVYDQFYKEKGLTKMQMLALTAKFKLE
jgi:hypothetical protein